ncbi:MAG: helix-turn-helix domain-containing protein [Bacteroidales bacterium]|nr:helix-turn-helix domain-containing protein [Bacteroidales bacterium]
MKHEHDFFAQELQGLRNEIREWQDLLIQHLISTERLSDKWLSLSDLIEYLPDKTSRATVYGWVSQGTIPYHKYGKKLTFLKSEIDNWLYHGNTSGKIEEKKIEMFR